MSQHLAVFDFDGTLADSFDTFLVPYRVEPYPVEHLGQNQRQDQAIAGSDLGSVSGCAAGVGG